MRIAPLDWYWLVAHWDDARHPTHLYSSKHEKYVPLDDPAYQEWLALGNRQPTRIMNADELVDVLMQQWAPHITDRVISREELSSIVKGE